MVFFLVGFASPRAAMRGCRVDGTRRTRIPRLFEDARKDARTRVLRVEGITEERTNPERRLAGAL